ncbi:MAG TPA: hypothetical protein VJX16_12790 [Terriglobales bacterium]|nr:hypothetical protein [Terriglobales bacterium]
MRICGSGLCAVLLLALGAPLLAGTAQNAATASGEQSTTKAPAEATQPQPTFPPPHSAHPVRQTLCWRQAGISPAAMNQRWKIQDNAKGRISEVCTEATLTPEKKRDRIRQINQETEQEIAKIIPAKQLDAFKACQAEQDREKAKHLGKAAAKELGPCGGIIPEQPAAPEHSHEQPHNPSK